VIAQCANLILGVRALLMASLNAVALTAEEARDFMEKLMDRDHLAEGEVDKMMDDLRDQAQAGAADVAQAGEELARKTAAGVEGTVEIILQRFNVPTRKDIEELSLKISELDKKVNALRAKRAGLS
jgi:poly(hydroxyalkanoate) granule-associated protein